MNVAEFESASHGWSPCGTGTMPLPPPKAPSAALIGVAAADLRPRFTSTPIALFAQQVEWNMQSRRAFREPVVTRPAADSRSARIHTSMSYLVASGWVEGGRPRSTLLFDAASAHRRMMTSDDVKAIRKSLGLTQRALAHWLGLSGTDPGHTVWMWETGRRRVTGPVQICLVAFASGYRPPHLPQEPSVEPPAYIAGVLKLGAL